MTVTPALARLRGCVVGLEDATYNVRIVLLQLVEGGPLDFLPGQFVRLTFGPHAPRDYSLANRPDEPVLEFHIRREQVDGASAYVWRDLRFGEKVDIEGPHGNAYWRRGHHGPILGTAGGSGLAPIKSIVETAPQSGLRASAHLYFGVRSERDVYLESRFSDLVTRRSNFSFVPVLSELTGPTLRRTGLVSDVVAEEFSSFDGFKAYIAGPPVMADAAVETSLSRGMARKDIHADPFYSGAEMVARGLRASRAWRARLCRRLSGVSVHGTIGDIEIDDFAELKLTDEPNWFLTCPPGFCGTSPHADSRVFDAGAHAGARLLSLSRVSSFWQSIGTAGNSTTSNVQRGSGFLTSSRCGSSPLRLRNRRSPFTAAPFTGEATSA